MATDPNPGSVIPATAAINLHKTWLLAATLFISFLSSVNLQAQLAQLHGTVTDSTAAPLQSAEVTAFRGDSQAGATLTDGSGRFNLPLAPGKYRLEISAPDFSTFTQDVDARINMQPLAIQLELAPIQQSLDVQDEPIEVTIDPDRNLSGLTLSDDDISNLPEDEDELAQYLEDLAGPGASAVGGSEMLVDGFSGGRLPPRDQIQEVRINNNPYSAEFSRPGRGRIEIRTRAGSEKLRGNVGFQLRDDVLNARNAFADTKPPYQRRNFRGTLSGPLIKDRVSFSLSGRRSDAADSDSINAITLDGPFIVALTRPNVNQEFGGRTQISLPKNQTLTLNVEYGSRSRKNEGAGGFALLERGASSENNELTFRVSETASLSEHAVNEFRLGFSREASSTTPNAFRVAINVQDAFQSGGAPRQNESTQHTTQLADLISWSRGKLNLKGGFQGNFAQYHTLSRDNFLGTFDFPSLEDFRAGTPTTFTVSSGDPVLDMAQFEWGIFLQSDYRVASNFMLSLGVRSESQNHISEAGNFDPRLGLAYSVNKSTVLRGGSGIFHQRLNANTVQSVLRLNGTRQLLTVIQNPSFPDPLAFGGAAELRLPNSLREDAPDLALPYTFNSSVSLEKRLPRGLFASVGYDYIRGVHLYRSRNINAPLPGQTSRPDPTRGNILLLESTASSRYHGLNININQRIGKRSVYGNYTYSINMNDSDGPFSLPANSYDLRSEWGRSSDNQRHTAFLGFNTPLPFGIDGNTRIRATSSRPYNITTGFDNNGDTITNDRPLGVARNTGTGPSFFQLDVSLRKTFSLRKTPPAPARGGRGNGGARPGAAGEGGRNTPGGDRGGARPRSGQGAGASGSAAPAISDFVSNFQRGPGGPGGGYQGGGYQGGGGPGGNNNRGGGPQLALTLNVNNLFNHTNLSQFSGVLTSPFFGRANSARSPREIEVGLQISF
jgi:hypothetical protein